MNGCKGPVVVLPPSTIRLYQSPALSTIPQLLAMRVAALPIVIEPEDRMKFFQELIINNNDRRGGPILHLQSHRKWSTCYNVFWWEFFKACHPRLQKMALRIFAQDCSSRACERTSSSFSLIHDKICNKFSMQKSSSNIANLICAWCVPCKKNQS